MWHINYSPSYYNEFERQGRPGRGRGRGRGREFGRSRGRGKERGFFDSNFIPQSKMEETAEKEFIEPNKIYIGNINRSVSS